MRALSRVLVALSLLAAFASPAAAQEDPSRLFVSLAAEYWKNPVLNEGGSVSTGPGGSHGYHLVAYQRDDLFRDLDIDARFNTDTLELTGRNLKLTDKLRLGAMLKGEAIFAGLLPDYYVRGALVPERGFNAGFVQGAASLEWQASPVFVNLELGGRRWMLSPNGNTSEDMVLPSPMTVFEPRLRVTWWDLGQDRSLWEPHRLYPRVSGFAAGAELGADFRSGWEPWGLTDGRGNFVDERNTEGENPVFLRAWLRGGFQLFDRTRIQSSLFASFSSGEDDLTRPRLGGTSPYSLPLIGLPWAGYLPQNFLSMQLSSHTLVYGESEVGLLLDFAQLSEADLSRVDYTFETTRYLTPLFGAGIFGDLRLGNGWQADARLGFALPSDALYDTPQFTAYLGVGKKVF